MNKTKKAQIELLKKYFKLDEERKVFDVCLHFEKASDLFETSLDSLNPKFKEEIFESIVNILDDIPRGYKADISISIDDFEDYEHDMVLSSINDVLFLIRYRYHKENKIRYIQAGLFLLAGIALIVASAILSVKVPFTSELVQGIFVSVTEIAAWVFVWQSVTLMFLTRSETFRLGQVLLLKAKNIELYHADSEKVLVKKSTKDIIDDLANNNVSGKSKKVKKK